jgi:hypothetical protein
LAFILYGYAARIEPVLVLHLILLPINIIRLLEALSSSSPHSAAGLATARRRHRPTH